jgi:hypothetical protein
VPEVRAKTGADFGIAETGCPFRLQCAEARLSCRGEPPVRLVCSSRNHWARCYAVRGESALC